MNINICNSQEDQYGNRKENIFLAFDHNNNYLGSAFAYPSINYHQTHETPYLIFIDVNVAENMDTSLRNEVNRKLFDKVFARAKELRLERTELKARIYAGFEQDKDRLNFYIKNGFEADYSIIMEAHIPANFTYTLPKNVKVRELKFDSDEEFMEYKSIYDEIFVTPIDQDALVEQERRAYFKNLSFIIDGKLEGGCTIFEKDGFGYIETVFVLSEKRGTGLSKIIMNYIFEYFISNGLNKTKLEVWQLNKRAVKLYETFGYKEVEKNLMFPGITF